MVNFRQIASGLALVAGASVPVLAGSRDTPEVAYQKAIEGKTPGKPVDCIDTRSRQPQLSAYGDKLIYTVDRKLVYVNQTTGGCGGVARGDALVSQRYQTRVCRGDIAQTVDFPARIPTGSCALGDFTPYTAK